MLIYKSSQLAPHYCAISHWLLQLRVCGTAWYHIISALESNKRRSLPSGRSRTTWSSHGDDTRTALLPISFRIKYKLCLLMYAAWTVSARNTTPKVLIPASVLPGRARSSISGAFDVMPTRTKFGKRTFSVAGPAAWNSLHPSLRQLTEIWQSKRAFTAHLYGIAYNS